MRLFLSALLLAAAIPAALGQNTTHAQQVIPGKALVKVKPEYKSLFKTSSSGRSALAAKAIRSLAPATAAKRNTGRAQAFKPVVDISQYFEVTFDPAQPVDQYIESLYATGYIEIAEPEYQQQLLYTPNDPVLGAGSQYYIQKIRADLAWDITQGSENMVIAIIDSGGDLDHPDLASQLYTNTADPINGIDDDGNGFIDDYRGWDFSGADAGNIIGDNDPSVKQSAFNTTHGTAVASCASAATDNGVGMAGVGFKTKLLFTKHFSDNTTSGSYNTDTYLGVLYAAQLGAKIINCSWGSPNASAIYHDLIQYVTQDLGCLVVAAAGNSNDDVRLYPASYDNVIAVAASDQNDQAAWFTSHYHTVDITAPGANMYIAVYNDTYTVDHGTSYAAPVVSGAAALLWAAHPEYTAAQVGEQLRVTADPVINQNSPALDGKLGKGRLDIYAALTQQSPSVRAANVRVTNTHGAPAVPGDTALIYLDFTNYLKATSSALQVTLTPESTFGTAVQSTLAPGAIGTNGTYTNTATPFRIKTSSTLGENATMEVRLDYSDGAYQDYQYVTITFNPTFITVDKNNITTTITSAGRIGFGDTQGQTQGRGFLFHETQMLYEMGLIMGTSNTNVLDNVRGMGTNYDQDFVSISPITPITPGKKSDMEVSGTFANSSTPESQTVNVTYRSHVWAKAPDDNFIILEYKIKNPQSTALTNFYYGIFADWDISSGGAQDAANWNAATKTGYVYAKQNAAAPYAGIQLLTANPQYYAIDNNQAIAGNPFGLYDGFSDTEKFTAISTSAKTQAGMSIASGTDVSHVVAAGPYTIQPNEEITIAFALLAAHNLNELLATAAHVDTVYNLTLQATQPTVNPVAGCIGKDITVTATGATAYKWYTDFTGGTPKATGPTITIPNFRRDTTLYVSNAGKLYESVRTKVSIEATPNPVAAFAMSSPSLLNNTPIQFTDKSTGAQNWLWNFGDNNSSNQQNPQHTFNNGGTYTIQLTVTTANGCQDATTQKLAIVTGIENQKANISLYPNPVSAGMQHTINIAAGSYGKTINATLSTPQGQQLTHTTFTTSDEDHTIDVSNYTPGLYILTLTTGNATHTYKILVTP